MASKSKGPISFAKSLKAEAKKITWPSKEETKKAIGIVSAIVAIYIVLISIADFIYNGLLTEILFQLQVRRKGQRIRLLLYFCMEEKAHWYVVHTYSGYENKVKINLEKAIENRNLEHLLHAVEVPMEEVIERKDDKVKVVLKKKFPGYVLVKMVMTEESWYIVRNTRGVTGFVGAKSNNPVPLTDEEVRSMGIAEAVEKIDLVVGESVKIITPPFSGFPATVMEINQDKRKVKVEVEMFGRATPAELDFNQIEKIYQVY